MAAKAPEFVVDASASVNFAVSTLPFHFQARQLLEECARLGVQMVAPAWWQAEADTALRKMVNAKILSPSAGQSAQQLLDALPIAVIYDPAVRVLARDLADLVKQVKVYDAVYLALAQVRGCVFWTADKRLFNAAQTAGLNYVRELGSFSSAINPTD